MHGRWVLSLTMSWLAGLDNVIPGGLLRFDIVVNVTSNVNPNATHILALKVRT